jgi:DNA-binding transcriptional LysR family regulator
MLDVRRLRYFLEVADTLHFTRAARSLGVSQQPLSRAIAELERDLGVRLFERTTRSVALTPAGEALREHGLLALQQLTLAERAARSEGRPTLRIVYPGTVAGLPHSAVDAFRATHAVTVTLALVRSWEQEALLLRGEADLAFVVPPARDERLAWRSLLRVPMVVAMRRDNPLQRRRKLRMSDLAEASWVGYSPRIKRTLHEFFRALCTEAGFSPRRSAEATDEIDAVRLVAEGRGLALVSASVRVGPEIALRKVAESPAIAIAAAWRTNDRRVLVQALVAALERESARITRAGAG